MPQASSQDVVQFDEPKAASEAAPMRERVLEMILPIIGESLMASEAPALCSDKTLFTLADQGVDPKLALEIFTKPVMIEIVKNYNLPPEAAPWFEAYYHDLEVKTGVDTGGISTQS